MSEPSPPFAGHCGCGTLRFELSALPLFVHGCHCTFCQRETGSAFAINALIESRCIRLQAGRSELVNTPSASGRGQRIARCPVCRIAVWSHYAGMGPEVSFVRVGTLDAADRLAPDVHIYTTSKLPWVVLPDGVPAVPEYYRARDLWPADSLARLKALRSA